MKTRTESINELIQERGYTSYLEIGLGNGVNFKSIRCESKIGVEPNNKTGLSVFEGDSDSFFGMNQDNFDLIFIDGLHHADQVEKDITNAWKHLNKYGMIILHDIKPPSKESTIVPRQQDQWVGSVFQAWYGFKEKYSKIKTGYIEEKYGLGTIEKSRHKVELGFVSDISFEEYMKMEGWKS